MKKIWHGRHIIQYNSYDIAKSDIMIFKSLIKCDKSCLISGKVKLKNVKNFSFEMYFVKINYSCFKIRVILKYEVSSFNFHVPEILSILIIC